MKKIIMTILCSMFLVFGILSNASALTISATDLSAWTIDVNYWTGSETANLSVEEIEIIVEYFPLSGLYKSDVGQADSWMFSDSYSTEYFNAPNDPSDATISWTEGKPYIDGSPLYLYVKDGNAEPAWYIFDITGWNGTDEIVLLNFWAGVTGAISHVAILGNANGTQVPEPGMVILLGIGLIGLAFFSRRKLLN